MILIKVKVYDMIKIAKLTIKFGIEEKSSI